MARARVQRGGLESTGLAWRLARRAPVVCNPSISGIVRLVSSALPALHSSDIRPGEDQIAPHSQPGVPPVVPKTKGCFSNVGYLLCCARSPSRRAGDSNPLAGGSCPEQKKQSEDLKLGWSRTLVRVAMRRMKRMSRRVKTLLIRLLLHHHRRGRMIALSTLALALLLFIFFPSPSWR